MCFFSFLNMLPTLSDSAVFSLLSTWHLSLLCFIDWWQVWKVNENGVWITSSNLALRSRRVACTSWSGSLCAHTDIIRHPQKVKWYASFTKTWAQQTWVICGLCFGTELISIGVSHVCQVEATREDRMAKICLLHLTSQCHVWMPSFSASSPQHCFENWGLRVRSQLMSPWCVGDSNWSFGVYLCGSQRGSRRVCVPACPKPTEWHICYASAMHSLRNPGNGWGRVR